MIDREQRTEAACEVDSSYGTFRSWHGGLSYINNGGTQARKEPALFARDGGDSGVRWCECFVTECEKNFTVRIHLEIGGNNHKIRPLGVPVSMRYPKA